MEPTMTLTVYKNSKTMDNETITDSFEITSIKRNGRVKVICTSNKSEYWVNAEELNNIQKIETFETEKASNPVITITPIKEVKSNTKPIITHTVKYGETFASIARYYNTSEVRLRQLNGADKLGVGQIIRIS